MEIITREQANASGLPRYFTSKPCKKNHIAERYTKIGACVACCREQNETYRLADPERHRARSRKHYWNNREEIIARREPEQRRERYLANRDSILEKQREYGRLNASAISERKRKYRAENKDALRERRREHDRKWRETNPEYYQEYMREWRRNNRSSVNASKAKRRALKRQAMLPDSDINAIRVFYDLAERLTRITGVQYHVDHIIPLSRGGAHHQDNLQVVRWDFNLAKGDRINFPSIGPGRFRDGHTDCDSELVLPNFFV
jgi:5-methylcytosine-specific restriction endonuclease McrA